MVCIDEFCFRRVFIRFFPQWWLIAHEHSSAWRAFCPTEVSLLGSAKFPFYAIDYYYTYHSPIYEQHFHASHDASAPAHKVRKVCTASIHKWQLFSHNIGDCLTTQSFSCVGNTEKVVLHTNHSISPKINRSHDFGFMISKRNSFEFLGQSLETATVCRILKTTTFPAHHRLNSLFCKYPILWLRPITNIMAYSVMPELGKVPSK